MISRSWVPAALLVAGLGAIWLFGRHEPRELRAPLDRAIPDAIGGFVALDIDVGDGERESARATEFLARRYVASAPSDDAPREFELHVCFYSSQTNERWSYAPRLCHQSPEWAILRPGSTVLTGEARTMEVGEFLLQGNQSPAVALVWYQGRGVSTASPMDARLASLRDGLRERRSDQAIVRLLVPYLDDPDGAVEMVAPIAMEVAAALDAALPPAD